MAAPSVPASPADAAVHSPLLQAFDRQVAWCDQAAAPFTAQVLARSRWWLAQDAAAHDAFVAALGAAGSDPLAAAAALRWAGALHHLALLGLQPWAGLWPAAPSSAKGAGKDGAKHSVHDGSTVGVAVGVQDGPQDADLHAALDAAIRTAWRQQHAHCLAALALPPQTNEVQRSAALLPGLLHVAARTGGLPLVLLEIGASAGLNLWCTRFRYETPAWHWGAADAQPCLRPTWQGPPPPLHAQLHIARRAGCDQNPIDLRQPGQSMRLASFIWPEQRERLARLMVAEQAATRWQLHDNVAVEALPADAFVTRELTRMQHGHATVLMHSVVWQYVAADQQQRISAAVQAAGARATPQQPLAWLRFEPPAPDLPMELRCRIWDGSTATGNEHLLARCHPHGARVEWLGGATNETSQTNQTGSRTTAA